MRRSFISNSCWGHCGNCTIQSLRVSAFMQMHNDVFLGWRAFQLVLWVLLVRIMSCRCHVINKEIVHFVFVQSMWLIAAPGYGLPHGDMTSDFAANRIHCSFPELHVHG